MNDTRQMVLDAFKTQLEGCILEMDKLNLEQQTIMYELVKRDTQKDTKKLSKLAYDLGYVASKKTSVEAMIVTLKSTIAYGETAMRNSK